MFPSKILTTTTKTTNLEIVQDFAWETQFSIYPLFFFLFFLFLLSFMTISPLFCGMRVWGSACLALCRRCCSRPVRLFGLALLPWWWPGLFTPKPALFVESGVVGWRCIKVSIVLHSLSKVWSRNIGLCQLFVRNLPLGDTWAMALLFFAVSISVTRSS